MESPSNATLLAAGTKCAASHCDLHDYLPYKCQFCHDSFCSDHFRPAAHHCEKEVSHDRIAPPCPLCNTPVSIPIGVDPNAAMERHFDEACQVMGRKKNSTPRCSRPKCGKVLYAAIRCESCRRDFCATHRHSSAHQCSSITTPQATPKPTLAKASTPAAKVENRLAGLLSKSTASAPSTPTKARPTVNHKPSFTSALPKEAVRISTRQATSSTTAPPSSSISNPFSKVDRRAKAEMESRRKALRERAKKGLLSEKEKQMLAQEEALLAQAHEAGSKKDCIVM